MSDTETTKQPVTAEIDLLEMMVEQFPDDRTVVESVRILNEQCPDCGSSEHHFGNRCGIYNAQDITK